MDPSFGKELNTSTSKEEEAPVIPSLQNDNKHLSGVMKDFEFAEVKQEFPAHLKNYPQTENRTDFTNKLNDSENLDSNLRRDRKEFFTKINFLKNEEEPGTHFLISKPFLLNTLSRAVRNTIPNNVEAIFQYDKHSKNSNTTENSNYASDNQSSSALMSVKQEVIVPETGNANKQISSHQEDAASKDAPEKKEPEAVKDQKLSQGLPIVVNGSKFLCTFCGKEFLKKQQLENHLKIHIGIKNFECNMCQKRFIHKQQLENHIKTHTGEKNFICEICSKRFIHKQQLENHRKIHTGQKDFACTLCSKRFTHKQQLQNHVKIHLGIKEFTCDYCDKKFTLKQQLVYHVKIHLGLKDFICSRCDRGFVTKQQLESHFRIHTGIRPYKCSNCNMDFPRYQQLQYHLSKGYCNFKETIPNILSAINCAKCNMNFESSEQYQNHVESNKCFAKDIKDLNSTSTAGAMQVSCDS